MPLPSAPRAALVLALALAACTSRSPAPLPAAPAGLALAAPVPGALLAAWQPAARASGYAVYVGLAGGAATRRIPVSGTSWSSTALAAGERYDVAVAALDGSREGPRSAIATLATRAHATLTVQSAAPGRITLSWAPASDGTYLLYRSVSTPIDPATATVIPVAGTDHVDGGVTAGMTYHYAVAGVASGLTGLPGPELAVTSPYPLPATAEPLASGGVTAFGQTIAAGDGLEIFPGQANLWDLDRDFSLLSGGLAGPFSGALLLYAGVLSPGSPTLESLKTDVLGQPRLSPFPFDQTYAGASFLTPLFGTADGVRTAEISDGAALGLAPLAGSRSLFLNGTAASRATQPIDVSAVTGPLTLSWSHVFDPVASALAGAPRPTFTVSFYGTDGGMLAGSPVYVATAREDRRPGAGGTPGASVQVGPWPGHAQVIVSFELAGSSPSYAELDGVTLSGGATAVANGDFEVGSLAVGDAGWSAPSPSESQNLESAPRTLCVADAGTCAAQLVVRRTFFAPPSSHWARITDVFENPGTLAVSAEVVYLTALASGGSEALHEVAGGGALIGYDLSANATRDFGIVYGSGTALARSATAAAVAGGAPDGDGLLFLLHALTVPPGGRVALVHFVLLAGSSTGLAGGSASPDLEADAAAILFGFASPLDLTYRNWMRPGDAEIVSNF